MADHLDTLEVSAMHSLIAFWPHSPLIWGVSFFPWQCRSTFPLHALGMKLNFVKSGRFKKREKPCLGSTVTRHGTDESIQFTQKPLLIDATAVQHACIGKLSATGLPELILGAGTGGYGC